MTNKILLCFGLVSALAGCSGEFTEEGTEPVLDRYVLGKSEQAIYVPAGYGTEDDQSACDNNWSGGFCDAPDFRAISLAVMTSTCDNEFDTYLKNTAERYRKFLVGAGWKVLWQENATPNVPGDNIVLSIGCDASTSGPELAVTEVNTTPVPFGSYECHEDSLGDFCQFQAARIKIFHNRIKAHSGWAGATATKRDNFVTNISQHELYHGAGLGHDLSAALGSKLMAVGAPTTGSSSNFWTIKLAPTSDQAKQLACYNPASGTQPADVPACPL